MPHVITAACFGCKYTDCVAVCPVEAFHEGEKMLYIHPETCIDCALCIPECPVEAIFAEEDVPQQYEPFVLLNEEMANSSPGITECKEPLTGV